MSEDTYCEMCLRHKSITNAVVPMALGKDFGWTYCEMSLCGSCVSSMPNLTLR